MKREEKTVIVNSLAEKLQQYSHFYLTDIAGLDAENTAKLRRMCFEKEVMLVVVKNTLFNRALEQVGNSEREALASTLSNSTAVMFSNTGNVPAKLIKEFAKGCDKPVLKAAYVEECAYIGAEQLSALINIKSREELIGDIIGLLQSPAKNVISALQSSGHKLSGIVQTLSERE